MNVATRITLFGRDEPIQIFIGIANDLTKYAFLLSEDLVTKCRTCVLQLDALRWEATDVLYPASAGRRIPASNIAKEQVYTVALEKENAATAHFFPRPIFPQPKK
jgi:hypothetical protein